MTKPSRVLTTSLKFADQDVLKKGKIKRTDNKLSVRFMV